MKEVGEKTRERKKREKKKVQVFKCLILELFTV